ncbi:MAG: outer membrane lipoprotein carrier protein LolA [Pelagibacterales bacterium]|nr:outer membrane lipoprotein carrier protein LolA [Pelagibacterales bacterium]
MPKRIILIVFFFISLYKYSYSSEIKKIIQKLEETTNLEFDFIQTLDKSIETGNCLLEFPNKFLCHYKELNRKKILIDNNILYLVDELNNKFSQNITGTYLLFLTDKNEMIKALKEIKDYKITENRIFIKLNFSQNETIDLYFDQKTYLVHGWKVINYDGTFLEFILKNVSTNVQNIGKFSID